MESSKSDKKDITDYVIGLLIAKEKYRFIDGRLIADVVQEAFKHLNPKVF